MRKPSTVLRQASIAVDCGGKGLYTAQGWIELEENGARFIDAFMPNRNKKGLFGFSPYNLPQDHRATILAFASSLAESEGF